MSLRLRIFGGVSLLLALLLGAAWFLVGTHVLKPIEDEQMEERLSEVVDIADSVEDASSTGGFEAHRDEVKRLMDTKGVSVRRTGRPPKKALKGDKADKETRDGRTLYILSLIHI